jgi:pimeloyl-ACP methyl ester carboxylesterase
VDGSGWEKIYHSLRRDGFRVSVVQNPTTSLADDVAATRRVIAAEAGPVVLVGHSYGGVVITEAGTDPNVAGLVYIAAFMADAQVPWGLGALAGAVTEPAWRSKPSWYLVATEDRMIPPEAQRAMAARAGATVADVAASHAVYVSQPGAVAELIVKAASEVGEVVAAR